MGCRAAWPGGDQRLHPEQWVAKRTALKMMEGQRQPRMGSGQRECCSRAWLGSCQHTLGRPAGPRRPARALGRLPGSRAGRRAGSFRLAIPGRCSPRCLATRPSRRLPSSFSKSATTWREASSGPPPACQCRVLTQPHPSARWT